MVAFLSSPTTFQNKHRQMDALFSPNILQLFDTQFDRVKAAARRRRNAVELKATVDDTAEAAVVDIRSTFGVQLPTDQYEGCRNLRTLRGLLAIVDDRGFERSPHQLSFHSAFERCVSRVIYKKDWSTSRPQIMKLNNWAKCSSEVLISTPRRFGKTFRYATFWDLYVCVHI